MPDIDVKAAVAAGEVLYRNGANIDGIATDDLAAALRSPAVKYLADYGGNGNGTASNDTPFANAISALNGAPGIIVLEPGDTGRETVYGINSPIELEPHQGLWSPQSGYRTLGATIKALAGFSGAYMVGNNTALYWHGGSIENIVIDCAGIADVGLWLHNMGEESIVRRVFITDPDAGGAALMLTGVHAVGTFEMVSTWAREAGTYGVKITEHPSEPADGNGGVVRFFGLSGDNGIAGAVGSATSHVYVDGNHTVTIDGLKSELYPRILEIAEDSNARVTMSGDAIRPSTAAGEVVKITGTAHPVVVISAMRCDQYANIVEDDVKGVTVAAATEGPHIAHLVWSGNATNAMSYDFAESVKQSNATTRSALRLRRFSAASTAAVLQLEDQAGTAWATERDMVRSGVLTTGEATSHRDGPNTNGLAMTSGYLRLAYFKPTKTETIDKIRVECGAVAAASSSATLIRLGVYSVAANGDLALIGSTPNDTTILSATGTAYTVDLSATEPTKTAGTIIAVGLLVVTGSTIPQVVGHQAFLSAAEMALAPRISGLVQGLSDLPSTVAAGSVGSTTVRPYFVCLP